jgi:hypothetical protein
MKRAVTHIGMIVVVQVPVFQHEPVFNPSIQQSSVNFLQEIPFAVSFAEITTRHTPVCRCNRAEQKPAGI